jgi:hypothetical protein
MALLTEVVLLTVHAAAPTVINSILDAACSGPSKHFKATSTAQASCGGHLARCRQLLPHLDLEGLQAGQTGLDQAQACRQARHMVHLGPAFRDLEGHHEGCEGCGGLAPCCPCCHEGCVGCVGCGGRMGCGGRVGCGGFGLGQPGTTPGLAAAVAACCSRRRRGCAPVCSAAPWLLPGPSWQFPARWFACREG